MREPSDLAGDHYGHDTHSTPVAGIPLAPGHRRLDTQAELAGGDNLDRGQHRCDTQDVRAPVVPLPAAIRPATPMVTPSSASDPTPGHPGSDTHDVAAGGGVSVPHDALLALLADAVDDLEDLRKATENRLRALTALPANELDTAKGIRGGPTVARATAMLDAIKDLEAQAIKDLERAMRAHPLGAWVKDTCGVGEKQGARLLAALGDPAARATPSQLWQYAGHGDPARSKRRKGQPVEHNPTAKMRTRLIAERCIIPARSPYRPVYDAARAAAVGKVHAVQCQNTIRPSLTGSNGSNGCGTREHPEWGAPGSPWRPGHAHGHALRLVGKAMLLDLWRAARGEVR